MKKTNYCSTALIINGARRVGRVMYCTVLENRVQDPHLIDFDNPDPLADCVNTVDTNSYPPDTGTFLRQILYTK